MSDIYAGLKPESAEEQKWINISEWNRELFEEMVKNVTNSNVLKVSKIQDSEKFIPMSIDKKELDNYL